MAERKVYSCDWCCVDAPMPGSIGHDWEVVAHPKDGSKLHLCSECFATGVKAWEKARSERFRYTHPLKD
jgi:hypothetical protein